MAPSVTHLYVHVPFCRSRCGYCDFASEPIGPHLEARRVERYLEVMGEELTGWVHRGVGPFATIYVGGGTPTVLPRAPLLELVARLKQLQAGVACRELTLEANPGTVDAELLQALASSGVTRLSLGVQSFSPRLREALGRAVEQEEIESAFVALAEAGWEDWNLDLVFGIPGQDWELAAADLTAAVEAGPTHISLYDLSYTPEYAAWVRRTRGAGARRAAGAFAERYLEAAVARLEAAGYRRYEISNFARPGYECRHNLAYWRGEDYLGVGASAVSTVGLVRWINPRSVADYLEGVPPQVERLSGRTRLWEKAMLGLRTQEGVEEAAVSPVLDQRWLARLLEQGCVRKRYGRLCLHPTYLNVSNAVLSTLLCDPDEGRQEPWHSPRDNERS